MQCRPPNAEQLIEALLDTPPQTLAEADSVYQRWRRTYSTRTSAERAERTSAERAERAGWYSQGVPPPQGNWRAEAAKVRLLVALQEVTVTSRWEIEEVISDWRGTRSGSGTSEEDQPRAEPTAQERQSRQAQPNQQSPAEVPAAAAVPHGEFQMPVRAADRRPNRYYTVTRVRSGDERHLGVWKAPWHVVADALGLPQRSLAHSGCHAVGFPHVGPAIAYWAAEGWAPPAPRLPRA